MNYECTYCDYTVDNYDDEDLYFCKKNGHEIIETLDEIELDSKQVHTHSKKHSTPKVKGTVGVEYVESVIVDDQPKFLVRILDNNDILIRNTLEDHDRNIRPLKINECGYVPYKFSSQEISMHEKHLISTDSLIEELKTVVDKYIVCNEIEKYLIIGDILLTYSQERISTIHYPFFVGETESGKSSVLHLGKILNYRCHYGEDIPNADIYNFLGCDEEGTGTIAEDEAQEIAKNKEKIRMYKNSYSKGSFKARILITDSNKQQIFYKTFCPKWFAGEKIPQDKGFVERLAVVFMTEGHPNSNIKRLSKEEEIQMNILRNRLLVWKMQNIDQPLDNSNTGLIGRDEELWADFMSISMGTKYFEKFAEVAKVYTDQRHQTIYNSLEAKLFKTLVSKLDGSLNLNFKEYWDFLTQGNQDLPGRLDPNSRRTFQPDEYPNFVTLNSLSKTLEQKFQGVKHKVKMRENGVQHQVTSYNFQKENLEKLAKKYGVENTAESPHSGELGEQGEQKTTLTTFMTVGE